MPSGHDAPRALSQVDGLAQLSFLVLGLLQERAAEHDLSIAQTRLLGILRDRHPTMLELGRLLRLEKSSVTGLVERAERRGLVARTRSPTDGRSVQVGLTKHGRALVTAASEQFSSDVDALLLNLPARDRDALGTLVSRLLVAQAASDGIDLVQGVGNP